MSLYLPTEFVVAVASKLGSAVSIAATVTPPIGWCVAESLTTPSTRACFASATSIGCWTSCGAVNTTGVAVASESLPR